MIKAKVRGIDWDTDGASAKRLGLPKNAEVELTESEYKDIVDGDPDIIADKLSDQYGYCVNGYDSDEIVTD